MKIHANQMHFKELNKTILASADNDIIIDDCIGQRYIGSGLSNKNITINGTPGNALGAYLDGAKIIVNGNAQDATGDTMNEGKIIINGNSGDATGYAMRGGRIYIKGNAGYRAGIHMKQYKEKKPILIIGESAGSFLGEYLAGGVIVVLGLECMDQLVGNFSATGMHGGKIMIRSVDPPKHLPAQVAVRKATKSDMNEITPYLEEFALDFDLSATEIINHSFYCLTANSKNPYKQLYTIN